MFPVYKHNFDIWNIIYNTVFNNRYLTILLQLWYVTAMLCHQVCRLLITSAWKI